MKRDELLWIALLQDSAPWAILVGCVVILGGVAAFAFVCAMALAEQWR